MRTNSSFVTLLAIHLLLLASCSSPPKPPSVDETNKRPVNVAMAIDLQACKSELHNTRIVASESNRQAESAGAALERAAVHQQTMEAVRAVMASAASLQKTSQNPAQNSVQNTAPNATQANSIFTLRFDFNSTRVTVPTDITAALTAAARNAPLVLLRGRTDGATDTGGASRIAQQRAMAVRDYLVAAGVDPTRIRTTHQPTGDHVTDNNSAMSKGMNRRVEVEIYRALPVAMNPTLVTTRAAATAATP
jgi:outer membrane protein OmpA-like peptidoglycan-associated protein